MAFLPWPGLPQRVCAWPVGLALPMATRSEWPARMMRWVCHYREFSQEWSVVGRVRWAATIPDTMAESSCGSRAARSATRTPAPADALFEQMGVAAVAADEDDGHVILHLRDDLLGGGDRPALALLRIGHDGGDRAAAHQFQQDPQG